MILETGKIKINYYMIKLERLIWYWRLIMILEKINYMMLENIILERLIIDSGEW